MQVARLQQLLLALQLLGALLVGGGLMLAAELEPIWAIGAGLLTPIGAHGAVIGAHFVAAARARRHLDPAAPAWHAGQALRAFGGELRASILTFAINQPLRSRYPIPSPSGPATVGGPGAALPVLLIHGYFSNRGLWRGFVGELAAAGHPVEAVDLEPAFGSIDDYVPIVAAAIGALRARARSERVALVCHSMGGLAARAYARQCGIEALALVITLGTPHHGTAHARMGIGRNARQMQPASDWLQALARDEDPALRARMLCILTDHDNIVSPQSSARLEGARAIELAALGHVELALDAGVRATIRRELAGARSEVNPAH